MVVFQALSIVQFVVRVSHWEEKKIKGIHEFYGKKAGVRAVTDDRVTVT